MREILMAVVVVGTIACAAMTSEPDDLGSWEGTIATVGGVTTVVNESGSVWGATAILVEEASIGVESGLDEYLFGTVTDVFATDERIYVVDLQVPQLRYYDLDGTHLGDIGQRGQGPGEYQEPFMLTGDGNGRIFLYDTRAGILVFSEDGEALDTWSYGVGPAAMVPTPNGTLWARAVLRDSVTLRRTYGVGEFGPDGRIGDVRYPRELRVERASTAVRTPSGGEARMIVPFSPASLWTISHSGAVIVGTSDRYRFEIQEASGKTTVARKRWAPVPIAPEEAEWHRLAFTAAMRRDVAGPDWTWNGADMPTTKPAFTWLNTSANGDIWVWRPGPGLRMPDCAEDPLSADYDTVRDAPCWQDAPLIDVFDEQGRFLGAVDPAPGMRLNFHVRDDQIVGVVEDDTGTLMVKRWRLVLPAP